MLVPGQRIVGFSFYGDVNSSVAIEKGYFDGIVGNLKLMPKFYPGKSLGASYINLLGLVLSYGMSK